jgi:hypothetical protein
MVTQLWRIVFAMNEAIQNANIQLIAFFVRLPYYKNVELLFIEKKHYLWGHERKMVPS